MSENESEDTLEYDYNDPQVQEKNKDDNREQELEKLREKVNQLEAERQKLAALSSTYISIIVIGSALLFNIYIFHNFNFNIVGSIIIGLIEVIALLIIAKMYKISVINNLWEEITSLFKKR